MTTSVYPVDTAAAPLPKDYDECATYSLPGAYAVRLIQHRTRKSGSFAVQYGHQVDHHLDYAQAAQKLGEAIMHALACEGRLDNERETA